MILIQEIIGEFYEFLCNERRPLPRHFTTVLCNKILATRPTVATQFAIMTMYNYIQTNESKTHCTTALIVSSAAGKGKTQALGYDTEMLACRWKEICQIQHGCGQLRIYGVFHEVSPLTFRAPNDIKENSDQLSKIHRTTACRQSKTESDCFAVSSMW